MDSSETSPTEAEAPQDSAPVSVNSPQTEPDLGCLHELISDDESCGPYDFPGACPNCGGSCGMVSPNETVNYYAIKPKAPLVSYGPGSQHVRFSGTNKHLLTSLEVKNIKPFLDSFTLFPKLPKEVRYMIWEHTLKSRVVEIEYSVSRGFYSRAKIPIAMKACRESRRAVLKSYPLSFGNILHKPVVAFNFSLDTLYFELKMQLRVTEFLVSLTRSEAESIQSIAVDRLMEEAMEIGIEDVSPDRALDTFKAASYAMPALKEFFIVHNFADFYDGASPPEGNGPPMLFEEFPYDLQMYVWWEGFDTNNFDHFSDCQILPDLTSLTTGFDVPKIGSVFGWRPTALLSSSREPTLDASRVAARITSCVNRCERPLPNDTLQRR